MQILAWSETHYLWRQCYLLTAKFGIAPEVKRRQVWPQGMTAAKCIISLSLAPPPLTIVAGRNERRKKICPNLVYSFLWLHICTIIVGIYSIYPCTDNTYICYGGGKGRKEHDCRIRSMRLSQSRDRARSFRITCRRMWKSASRQSCKCIQTREVEEGQRGESKVTRYGVRLAPFEVEGS